MFLRNSVIGNSRLAFKNNNNDSPTPARLERDRMGFTMEEYLKAKDRFSKALKKGCPEAIEEDEPQT